MSTLTITIDLDNEAFQIDASAEVNRILKVYTAFNALTNTIGERSLFDINGNKVGKAEVLP